MTIQMSEYIDVKERALELGCSAPTKLAILPRNFETAKSKDELVHESSAPTVRVLWRQAGISETRIEKEGDKFPYVKEMAFQEWLGPVIFVSTSLLSQNPHVIEVALGVISNYLTHWFRGIAGDKVARLDIVVEETKKKRYRRIRYEGNAEGLQTLPRIVREVSDYE